MNFQIQIFQVAGLVFAILGFIAGRFSASKRLILIFKIIIGFVAILTPSWQVVYAREIQQWIQSGLWLNCQTRPNGMYTCAYSFSEHDYDFYTSAELINLRTPPFYSMLLLLLSLLIL